MNILDIITSNWQFGLIALIFGILIGVLFFWLLTRNGKDPYQQKKELNSTRLEFSNYKSNINHHFEKSSKLLNKLTQNHIEFCQHLESSTQAYGDSKQLEKTRLNYPGSEGFSLDPADNTAANSAIDSDSTTTIINEQSKSDPSYATDTTDKTDTNKAVTDRADTDKTVIDKAVTDKTDTDKTVIDKAVSDKPVTDKPVTDKPVTDKPVTDKPVTDKPVTDKATKTEPDLLNPPIDETTPTEKEKAINQDSLIDESKTKTSSDSSEKPVKEEINESEDSTAEKTKKDDKNSPVKADKSQSRDSEKASQPKKKKWGFFGKSEQHEPIKTTEASPAAEVEESKIRHDPLDGDEVEEMDFTVFKDPKAALGGSKSNSTKNQSPISQVADNSKNKESKSTKNTNQAATDEITEMEFGGASADKKTAGKDLRSDDDEIPEMEFSGSDANEDIVEMEFAGSDSDDEIPEMVFGESSTSKIENDSRKEKSDKQQTSDKVSEETPAQNDKPKSDSSNDQAITEEVAEMGFSSNDDDEDISEMEFGGGSSDEEITEIEFGATDEKKTEASQSNRDKRKNKKSKSDNSTTQPISEEITEMEFGQDNSDQPVEEEFGEEEFGEEEFGEMEFDIPDKK